MFIRFDDLDLLDFFENEPISVGAIEEDRLIYSTIDRTELSMTMAVDAYSRIIDISINYKNQIVFSSQFQNILEIKKRNDTLLVETEENKRIVIKKSPCLGVIIENYERN